MLFTQHCTGTITDDAAQPVQSPNPVTHKVSAAPCPWVDLGFNAAITAASIFYPDYTKAL